jgi:hypothetical protein
VTKTLVATNAANIRTGLISQVSKCMYDLIILSRCSLPFNYPGNLETQERSYRTQTACFISIYKFCSKRCFDKFLASVGIIYPEEKNMCLHAVSVTSAMI